MSSPSTMKVVQILSLKLQQNPSEIYEITFPQNSYWPQEITISKNNDPIVIITLAKDYSGSWIGNGKEIGGGEAGKRDIKEEIQDSYSISIKYKTDKMFDIMAADEASYQEAIKVIEMLYNIYFTNALPSSAASIADIL